MPVAVTREISPRIGEGERTHVDRYPIDPGRAAAQHAEYVSCLLELGCEHVSLSPEPDLPDAVFVEDAAVVLDELAVITRPGASSRRPETASVARALASFRSLVRIEDPATLDGGDVLRVDRTLFVGRSSRTDEAACEQLRRATAPFGYRVHPVNIRNCLHLKSAATLVAPGILLVNRDWVDVGAFGDLEIIEVHPREAGAANALLVGETVVHPCVFPRTRESMERRGLEVRPVDVSELAKAEGGVTCCSLIFSR
jgi:dimethylargininase